LTSSSPRFFSGKNVQPTLLSSLPRSLKSLNIQSALPASLPFTIAPLVHSYLLSHSTLLHSEGTNHSRSISLIKGALFQTSIQINEVDDNASELGRDEDILVLPSKAKVYIAEGEDWTATCEDDLGRLRELMEGVGELEVEGEEEEGKEKNRKVVVAGEGDGGWGTIGRGCVQWGVRVEW